MIPILEEPWDYWPPGIPDDCSFESFIILFEALGYEKDDRAGNSGFEVLYEKVALYADDEGFNHVASQLSSGAWTSKLGPEEDIMHNSLEDSVTPLRGFGILFWWGSRGFAGLHPGL